MSSFYKFPSTGGLIDSSSSSEVTPGTVNRIPKYNTTTSLNQTNITTDDNSLTIPSTLICQTISSPGNLALNPTSNVQITNGILQLNSNGISGQPGITTSLDSATSSITFGNKNLSNIARMDISQISSGNGNVLTIANTTSVQTANPNAISFGNNFAPSVSFNNGKFKLWDATSDGSSIGIANGGIFFFWHLNSAPNQQYQFYTGGGLRCTITDSGIIARTLPNPGSRHCILFSNTAFTQLDSSTTEVNIGIASNSPFGNPTFSSNLMLQYSGFQIEIPLVYIGASNTNFTTFRLKFNSNTVSTINTPPYTFSNSNMQVIFKLFILATSGSNNCLIAAESNFPNANSFVDYTLATIDFTASQTVSYSVQWSGIVGTNSVSSNRFIMKPF